MSTILITRPADQAKSFAQKCEALGFKALIEPMLTYENIEYEEPKWDEFEVLIFTSAQAVRALKNKPENKDIQIHCVGEKTAALIKQLGFNKIIYYQDANTLRASLSQKHISKGLYLRGEDISIDLAKTFDLEERNVYRAIKTHTLSKQTQNALENHEIDVVPLFSKRSAEAFIEAARASGLAAQRPALKYLCISAKVLEYVQTYSLENTHTAPTPDEEGMIEALRSFKNSDGRQRMSTSSKKAIENANAVIERFGGIRPMAKKMEVAVTTVQGWKKRDRIPGNRLNQIIEAANSHDVDLSDILDSTPPVNENKQDRKPNPIIENPDDFEVQKAQYVSPEEPKEDEEAPVTLTNPIEDAPLTEPLNKQLAAAEQKAVQKSVWISAGLIGVGVLAIGAMLWPQNQTALDNEARLKALENEMAAVENQVEGVQEDVQDQQNFFGALIPEDLDQQLESLREKASETQEQLGVALEKAQEVSKDVLSENAGTLEERYTALESHVSELAGMPAVAALMQRFNVMEASPETQGTLDQTMSELAAVLQNARDEAFALQDAKVSGFEGETLDSQTEDSYFNAALESARAQSAAMGQTFENVPGNDLKAAALLLGMSQFRSSLNRDNEAFEDDLSVLMNLIGEDNPELTSAMQRLAPHAKDGVLTPSGLSTEFKTLAGDAVVASLKGEDVSISERAQARFNDVFQVEKNGELVTGTETQATIQSAEKSLDNGDIEAAIQQLESLDGEAAKVMAPWIGRAQASLMAKRVREMLGSLSAFNISPDTMIDPSAISEGGVGGLLPSTSKLVTDDKTGINILKRSDGPLGFGRKRDPAGF